MTDSKFSIIEEHNKKRISEGKISCATAMVIKSGETVYHGIFGTADIEAGKPLCKNALFRLASMTKPVVSAAIMREFDAGKLDIFDEIARFIPSFDKMHIGAMVDGKPKDTGVTKNNIRIVDLLTHSSGLGSGPVGDAQSGEFFPKTNETLGDVIPKLGNMLLDFEPRTNLAYSGLFAFDTMAHIVEISSGMTFPDYLSKYIFAPIGIRDITYAPTDEQWNRVVTMYEDTGHGCRRVEMGRNAFGTLSQSYTSGGAGLIGSIEDYSRFVMMLAGGGKYEGVRVLSENAVRLMRTSHQPMLHPINAYPEMWGLGMRVINQKNAVLPHGSFGWSGAYGTHFWIDPSNDIVALYCSNMTTAGGAGAETAREFERDVMGI